VQREDLDLADDDSGAREMAFADNRVGEVDLSWDPEQILADINAGVDLGQFWSGDELDAILGDLAGGGTEGGEPADVTETEAERLAKEYGVEPGQVWQLGRHVIACLDCLEWANVERLVDGQTVGMVWADPPYGMDLDTDYTKMADWANRQVGGKYEGFRRKGGSSKSQAYDPVIGDNKPFDPDFIFDSFGYVDEIFLWGADYYAEAIPDRTAGSWLVWDKRSDSQGGNLDEMFGSSFELCWSRQPHKRDLIRVRWAGYFGTETQDIKRRIHPNQKPVQLPRWVFEKYGKPGDLILDPFLGSGISVLAAEQMNDNRRVIGFELVPAYIGATIYRWQQLTNQDPRLL
jgi:DNA modification methylase